MTTSGWIFQVLGWVVFCGGALWLLLALFRDRPRGRRRCPRCWYDMGGIDGLRCPECGTTARSERKLFRTRRGWRAAFAAAVLMLAGLACTAVPEYQREGWTSLVPSTWLVYFAPLDQVPVTGVPAAPGAGSTYTVFAGNAVRILAGTPGTQVTIITGGGGTTTVPIPASGVLYLGPKGVLNRLPPSSSLRQAVWNRLTAGKLWRWQSQVFLDRFYTQDEIDIALPDVWAMGERVPVVPSMRDSATALHLRLGKGGWDGPYRLGQWSRLETPFVDGPVDLHIELRAANKAVYRRTVRDAIELRPLEKLLTRMEAPEHNRAALEALRPRLVVEGDAAILRVDDNAEEAGVEMGLFFEAEVERDGRLLARTRGNATWGRRVWKKWEDLPLKLESGVTPKDLEGATLRLRGLPEPAAEHYVDRPFGKAPECWAGEMTVPLPFEETP